MSAIRFCENTKVAVFVLGKLCVKSLQQSPHVGCSGDSAGDFVIAVRETGADGLIDVEHIGITVEAVGIEGRCIGTIHEMAWTFMIRRLAIFHLELQF